MQFASVLMYRTDYILGIVGVLTQVFLLSVVWTAVYGEATSAPSEGAGRITLSTQIAYATLASLQYWLLNPWNLTGMMERIRSGTIAVDLVRPVPLLLQALAGKVGATAAMTPFALAGLPLAILAGGAEPPASVTSGLAYAASLVLAYVLSTLLHTLVELLAFWTLEVGGLFMIYRMVGQFCAGVLVPLWFMPDWLRLIAEWLPFQATTYTPLTIYLGRVTGTDAAVALGTQLGWVIVVLALLRLAWSRAIRRVVVQGG